MLPLNSFYKWVSICVLVLLIAACSSGDDPGGANGLKLNVTAVGVTNLQFSWSAYSGATFYRLFVNPDGVSGFSQVGSDLTNTSTDVEIPVHLTDWINASYLLEAHDASGKIATSSVISITNLMLSTIGYAKASNTDANDRFGYSISISGDGNTLAVGAELESSNATGINGDQSNNAAGGAGAVYVFTRSGTSWNQQAYVKASNTGYNDNFGSSVSLSGDGNTLVVGAPREDSNATGINSSTGTDSATDAGAVYVFTRSGTSWSQQAYIKASNTDVYDRFGYCVSLSSDGSTLAVGAVDEASAATGIDGDETNNSTGGAGAVYVFTRSGSNWSQQAYVKASNTGYGDGFGWSVSISGDGNVLAAGAVAEASVATGIDGDQTNNTAGEAGAVYVFTRSGSVWSQNAYIKASNTDGVDYFGYDVSVSSDGNTLAVGAMGEDSTATGIDGDETNNTANEAGAVYVFVHTGGSWSQQAYVKASNTEANDAFGVNVSLSSDGNTLAVGAFGENSTATGIDGDQTNNTMTDPGAVYVFTRSGSDWSQLAYVKATNPGFGDIFGTRVSLSGSGNKLIVGTRGEDSNATGINGDQTDNSSVDSGAVYIY